MGISPKKLNRATHHMEGSPFLFEAELRRLAHLFLPLHTRGWTGYSPGGSNRYNPITMMGAAMYMAFFPNASFTP